MFYLHTTSTRSASASPLLTELMRTARSFMPVGMGWSIVLRIRVRASAFFVGVTLSSRSYATQSATRLRDLSSIRWEEPGTMYEKRHVLAINRKQHIGYGYMK